MLLFNGNITLKKYAYLLDWCGLMNVYEVSAWRLNNHKICRCSVETDYINGHKSDQCNRGFWPSKLNINRGHFLTKTNQRVKYKRSMIKSSQDNEHILCLHVLTKISLNWSLWPWPLTCEHKSSHVLTKGNQLWNKKVWVI